MSLNVYCHDQFGQSVFCINPHYQLRLSAFTTPNTNVRISLESPSETLVNEEITTDENGAYMYINYTLGETLQHGIYKLKAQSTNETDVKEYTYPNE
tara:strand:+ start:1352 stop:1642 length:291 start_codon:yes stop_codon:yes gene_type:complete